MVRSSQRHTPIHLYTNPEEAAALRRQADRLLRRLQASREVCEQRCAETGRRDPMKTVTGRSALEQAIASTREMIQRMDTLLAEMNRELNAAAAPVHRTAPIKMHAHHE